LTATKSAGTKTVCGWPVREETRKGARRAVMGYHTLCRCSWTRHKPLQELLEANGRASARPVHHASPGSPAWQRQVEEILSDSWAKAFLFLTRLLSRLRRRPTCIRGPQPLLHEELAGDTFRNTRRAPPTIAFKSAVRIVSTARRCPVVNTRVATKGLYTFPKPYLYGPLSRRWAMPP